MDLPVATPALIIFDWDDTLVDSYAAIHHAINAARAAFHLPTWTLAETRENCRIALREIFPVWFGDAWPRAQDIFYEAFAAEHIALLREKDGARELLQQLRQHNIPLAVNSNKKAQYLREEIEHLGWRDYFQVIIGAGDVARGKPAPDGALRICAECHVPPTKNVWFVGDNGVDEATAQACGILSVIVGEEAAGMLGEVVVPHLNALAKYCNQLGKES